MRRRKHFQRASKGATSKFLLIFQIMPLSTHLAQIDLGANYRLILMYLKTQILFLSVRECGKQNSLYLKRKHWQSTNTKNEMHLGIICLLRTQNFPKN